LEYRNRFYSSFSKVDASLSHLSLFQSNHKNIEEYLLDQDIVYVGGGNTYNMLILWKDRRIDKILKKAWEIGVVLAGISAGSLCWFKDGNTDSFGELENMPALGFLPFSNSPHYDSEINRRPHFKLQIQQKKFNSWVWC